MSKSWHQLTIAICTALLIHQSANGEETRFYLVWGLRGGGYHGELAVEHGEFLDVDPWQWEPADALNARDKHRITWIGNVYNGCDGLEFMVRGSHETRFRLRFTQPHQADVTFRWADVQQDSEHVVPLGKGFDFAAYGPGDIRRGPQKNRYIELPAIEPSPTLPESGFLALPDDWWRREQPLKIHLTEVPTGKLRARRIAGRDGRLLILLDGNRLTGTVRVDFAGKKLANTEIDGQLWIECAPRIGFLNILVEHPGGQSKLRVPTTLVETDGSCLRVNGEPFLVKGTLPRSLNDQDAAYLKSLGANTLRMRPTDQVPLLQQHGFMLIASCHTGPGRLCERAETDQDFRQSVTIYVNNTMPLVHSIADHPHTLILQVGNEQVTGQDPWLSRFRPPHTFERLDYLLTRLHNTVSPVQPMLPIGYSNCAFGYIAPEFLDVYLHNTYLDKDRDWPPLEEFMRLQSCDKRPYIHTEFGANTYMPQLHLRGPNSPLLEKLHAWNFPCRWASYQAAGAQGATNYCLYDYDYSNVNRASWDKGFTNFGIMTFDRQPKLACWELWHLWRDFTVTPRASGQLQIHWKRNYFARQCRLTLQSDNQKRSFQLEDFTPHSTQFVGAPWSGSTFRWRIDYTTHGGLPMQACGGHPTAIERADFLDRLKGRDTYSLLKELLDAEVITIDGRPAPPTLREMQREDGVVAVAFRTRSGDTYVTAFTRRKPADGFYREDVTLEMALSGRVAMVDEFTGQAISSSISVQHTSTGVRIANLRVPYLPSHYGQRATEPIGLPVLKLTPSGDELSE